MGEMMKHTISEGAGKWFTFADSYRKELKISWEELYNMTKEDLKKRIQKYDTTCWENNLISKATLEYYREGKKEIGYESCYRNNMNSLFLARARINSLKLEEAIGRGKDWYNDECKLCGIETENLLHFIIKCPALERKREFELLEREVRDPRQKLIRFLFDKAKNTRIKRSVECVNHGYKFHNINR